VLVELLVIAPGGVEEATLPDGTIEFAVYGVPGELPTLPDMTAAAGDALVAVRTEEIAHDWQDRWRSFHRPLVIDDRLTVRPPWEHRTGRTALDVVINPGQAFGTGAHATTQLCLEFLLALDPAGPFVDLGCGSGVLAICAAKLGFRPVVALDFDAAALEATGGNARRNGVRLEVRRYDLRSDPVEASVGPTVVANLLAPLLLAWAGRLSEADRLPERVIAGGLLVGEADRVAKAFAGLGFREAVRSASGDWAALLLRRDVHRIGALDLPGPLT
jgi:ribosomal protein L11 methyltransferase